MTGDLGDASKVDPLNVINVTYEDLSEKQRQKFEADLKQQNEELKARMLACYGKTRQGVIQKETFVMPSISTTTPPPPAPAATNVSSSHPDLYSMLLTELRKKINDAQVSTQNTLIDISERMNRLEKGKSVDTTYSTKDLTFSSAAPTSTVMWNLGCHRIISLGSHHCQAPFGHPRSNRSDRSHRPVKLLPRRPVRSDRCHGAGLGVNSSTRTNSKFGCSWPNR